MIPLEKLKEKHNILIMPAGYKMRFLNMISKESIFYHIHFLTLQELKHQLFYEYKPDALFKFCQKWNVIPENGAVLLDAMYELKSKEQDERLYEQKKWLEEQNLMIFHPGFTNQLKRSNVFVYGYEEYELRPFLDILNQYSNIEYLKETEQYLPTLTEYETLENEVVGVAEKIQELLLSGISINQIYICNIGADYKSLISKIYKMFQIPYQTLERHSLFEYQMIQDFLASMEGEPLTNLSELLLQLETKYPKSNAFYNEIYEAIISILNPYYKETRTFQDIKDILIYDFKQKYAKKEVQTDIIKEVSFLDTYFEPDDYIFLLGANLGEFPPIYEDTEYFNDTTKKKFGLLTSLEKTLGIEQKIKNKILSLPHVFISYKKKSPFKEYLKSPLLDSFYEQTGEYHYTNKAYNTYLLNASLDDFVKYNEKTVHLKNRYGIEPVYYGTYDNQFTGIEKNTFQKYVPYCVLSYTAMQKFFECPFKYYLNSILKIVPPFKETTSLIVGNLFHSILEQYFKKEKTLDDIIHNELETIQMEPIEKRDFYIKKYELEIKRLIELMEKQLRRSEFQPTYFEKTIEWTEQKEITFKLFGKIDKIMTIDDGTNSYIIVIDYKTGFSTSDLSKVIYGMNMQLLLYLYFISKEKSFSKYKLGGAYIQSISSFIPNYTEGKTMEELLWEQSKLDGISVKRTEFISRLDTEYQLSSYVKGIRVKKDGDFYASNRLLEPSALEKLLEIVKNNIDLAELNIENANFEIAPKKFSNEFQEQASSCSFCPYRDICYLKPKNVVLLKEDKDLEFLGGENNDTSKTN